jgi:hypothetical protein
MNSTETSPAAGSRISRIQKVSGIFKVLFLLLTLVCIVASLESLGALAFAMCRAFRWSTFASDWYALMAAGADLVSAVFLWFCYRLFKLYSRANFFTAEVVGSLRRIGLMFFFVTVVGVLSVGLLPHHRTSLSEEISICIGDAGNGLFFGFLILFIAWVMDEGRRIQEDLALTV